MTITKPQPALPTTAAEHWTYTRYLRETVESEYFSVIGGERLMSPSPNRWHQTALINLATQLKEFAKRNQLGTVLVAPFDVYFSEDEFVQPDLLFVAKEHVERLTDNGVKGAPDLVVEIVSPGSARTDRLTKRNLYAKHGVSEHWIISPNERTIEVLSLKEGNYESVGLYEGDEAIKSPLLPGLLIVSNPLFDE